VSALDVDRRRGVLHQRELAAAQFAAIGLQQEGRGAAPSGKPRAVVKQAAIAFHTEFRSALQLTSRAELLR